MARFRSSHKADELEKLIEARIRQGRYAVESRLPTEREVGEELNVARGTIRKVYRNLHHRGLVSYNKRSYQVLPFNEEYEFEKKYEDSYGIFFSQKRSNAVLMRALESRLRQKKCSPVYINLDSMNVDLKNFSMFDYLHLRLKGAFFLSSYVGEPKVLITESMIDKLPFPSMFLGVSHYFKWSNYLSVNSKSIALKCLELLKKNNVSKCGMVFAWPVKTHESEWLSSLSKALERVNIVVKFYFDTEDLTALNESTEWIICLNRNFKKLIKTNKKLIVIGDIEGNVEFNIGPSVNDLVKRAVYFIQEGRNAFSDEELKLNNIEAAINRN